MVTTAVLVGVSGFLALETQTQLRDALSSGDETMSRYVVQTRLPGDAAAKELQQHEAQQLFEALFADSVLVERTITPAHEVRVRWTITANTDTLDAQRLTQLNDGFDQLGAGITAAGIAPRGAEFDGTLNQSAQAAARELGVVAALSPIPLLLAALLGWIALAQLARLLSAVRATDSELLRARGLSRLQLVSVSVRESVVLAVLGTLAGTLLALGVLALFKGSSGVGAALAYWPIVVLVAVVAAPVLTVAASRLTPSVTARMSPGRRGARLVQGATAALVLLAAAVLIWQLRVHGVAPAAAPVWERAVTSLAPLAAIFAGAVVGVIVFVPFAAAAAGVIARGAGFAATFVARGLARRVGASAVALMLVAVAVGGAVIASAYAATWEAGTRGANVLAVGADLRASVASNDTVSPQDVAAALALEGIEAAAPAEHAEVMVGKTPADFVALPAASVGRVVTESSEQLSALTEALAPSAGATLPLALPEHTTALRARIALPPTEGMAAPERLDARVWLMDVTGTTVSAPMVFEQPDPTSLNVLIGTATLPVGTAPWALVGMTAEQLVKYAQSDVVVRLEGIEAVGATSTAPIELAHAPEPVVLAHAERQGVLWNVTSSVQPAPGVITRALAERLQLNVGDVFNPIYQGTGRTATIVVRDIVDVVPGAPQAFAVFAALDALAVSSLLENTSIRGANEVWATGAPEHADALASAIGAVRVDTASGGGGTRIVATLLPTWWIGAAAGILLAVVALAAITAEHTRSRRGEVGLLRALGVRPRTQAALRSAEVFAVLGLGALFGAAIGVVVSLLVIPELVGAALASTGSMANPAVVFAAVPLAILLGCLLFGVVVVVAVQRRALRRQASTALPGGGER